MDKNTTGTDELKRELEGIVQPLTKKYKEIRSQLDELMKEGRDPGDGKVTALEARLVELEQELRETKQRVIAPPAADQKRQLEDAVERAFLATAAQVAESKGIQTPLLRFFGSADLASAGKLSPEQAQQFLDYVMDETVVLRMIDGAGTNADTVYLDEIGISRRNMRTGVEGHAPAPANAVNTARRTITTQEFIWAEDVSRNALEDNIEGQQLRAHVARLLARAFGNDTEDLALNGDTSLAATITDSNSDGKDDTTGLTQNDHAFLRQLQGWLQTANADTNVPKFDASGASSVKAVFRSMLATMPTRYRGLPLAYLLDPDTALAYADLIADRQTGVGDETLINGLPVLRYYGYRIVPAPYMTHERADLGRFALLTVPENLAARFQRAFTLEAEWKPRTRMVEFTLTARWGINYKKSDLIVLGTNVPAF